MTVWMKIFKKERKTVGPSPLDMVGQPFLHFLDFNKIFQPFSDDAQTFPLLSG